MRRADRLHRAMRLAPIAAAALFAGTAIAQQAAVPDAATALPPGPGQPQVVAACSACHAITVVTNQRYTAAKWDEVVAQMVSRGAPVSDADYDAVVDYLAKNYGAK